MVGGVLSPALWGLLLLLWELNGSGLYEIVNDLLLEAGGIWGMLKKYIGLGLFDLYLTIQAQVIELFMRDRLRNLKCLLLLFFNISISPV